MIEPRNKIDPYYKAMDTPALKRMKIVLADDLESYKRDRERVAVADRRERIRQINRELIQRKAASVRERKVKS